MNTELDRFIEDVSELVSLPDVYYRLEEAIEDPHMSLEDVAQLLASDPDLTARVLRLANSAFFGFPSQIETPSRAVTTIGTQQLRDLVLATTIIRLFSRLPLAMASMKDFWTHSIGCGVTARVLATWRRETNVERFYVAGLLHDIGRVVLYLKRPDVMHDLLLEHANSSVLLYELERNAFGFDHAAVGGALLRAWNIPAALYEPVGAHHDPQAAQRYPVETAVVHLADIIVNCLGLGSSGQRHVPPLDESAWARVEIPESALAQITQRAEQQTRDLLSLFLPA